jgi:hypothetical protein
METTPTKDWELLYSKSIFCKTLVTIYLLMLLFVVLLFILDLIGFKLMEFDTLAYVLMTASLFVLLTVYIVLSIKK